MTFGSEICRVERKPMIPEFKVLGHWLTFKVTWALKAGDGGDTSPNQNIRRDVPSKNTHENIKK